MYRYKLCPLVPALVVLMAGCRSTGKPPNIDAGLGVHEIVTKLGIPDAVSDTLDGFPRYYLLGDECPQPDFTFYYVRQNLKINFDARQVASCGPIDTELRELILDPLLKNGHVTELQIVSYLNLMEMRRSPLSVTREQPRAAKQTTQHSEGEAN